MIDEKFNKGTTLPLLPLNKMFRLSHGHQKDTGRKRKRKCILFGLVFKGFGFLLYLRLHNIIYFIIFFNHSRIESVDYGSLTAPAKRIELCDWSLGLQVRSPIMIRSIEV